MNHPKPDTAAHGPPEVEQLHRRLRAGGGPPRPAGSRPRRRGRGGCGRLRRGLQPPLRRLVRRDRGRPGRQAALVPGAERLGAVGTPAAAAARGGRTGRRRAEDAGPDRRRALPRAVRGGADRRLPDRRPRPGHLQQPALADHDGADPGGGPGLRLGPGDPSRRPRARCSTTGAGRPRRGTGRGCGGIAFCRRRARCGGSTPGRRRCASRAGGCSATSAPSRTSPIKCRPRSRCGPARSGCGRWCSTCPSSSWPTTSRGGWPPGTASASAVTGYTAAEIVGNPRAAEVLHPDAEYREPMLQEWRERAGDFRDWEWRADRQGRLPAVVAWSNLSAHYPVPGWRERGPLE